MWKDTAVTWGDSWVSFDTETTGFGPMARVLEVGVVYFEHGKPVDEWSTLLSPPDLDWNHPDVMKALAINQLTEAKCAGAPNDDASGVVAVELLGRLQEDVWVGHHVEFDIRMIQQEMDRAKIPFAFRPSLVLCTKQLSNKLHPNEKGHKLQEVAPRWGVVQEDAHRAVVDAKVAGLVVQSMLQSDKLPIQGAEMVSFSKEAALGWNKRPKGRW